VDAALLELQSRLPAEVIDVDPHSLQSYGQDWTRFSKVNASVVLKPQTIEQIQTIIALAKRHQCRIVPSGGRTGLAGGAVATQGEWILSMDRFCRMGTLNTAALSLECEAGVTLEKLQEHLSSTPWQWPVDLASKGSAQIGGLLSTNAGGLKVIRYGHVRRWVQSITMVDGESRVQVLNGPIDKNNSGYNFRELVIGAEGTLGVLVAAHLKLCRKPQRRVHALRPAQSVKHCLESLIAARSFPLELEAFEFFSQDCVNAVLKHRPDLKSLPPAPWYCLWSWDASVGMPWDLSPDEFKAGSWLESAILVEDSSAHEIWAYRESITEALSTRGLVYKNDVAVPVDKLEDFLKELQSFCARAYQGFEVYFFGHLGDGNVHINIVNPNRDSPEAFRAHCESTNPSLYACVANYGGSCAAEHGIGLLKKKELLLTRGPSQVEWMKQVKKVFDPHGLFNPGKIFEADCQIPTAQEDSNT